MADQQLKMKQPRVRRPKTEVIPTLDKWAKALDTARSERLSAQTDEKKAEEKCIELMQGNELETYQLSDGRFLHCGPKTETMGCKIKKPPEDDHDTEQGELDVE